MKINRKLLPIKGHYFFFMAAMGPILPQLQVYGKELGVSSVVMGTVTGILPIIFLIAKPLFGLLIDIYRNYRKTLFMSIIFAMGLFYALLYLIPARHLKNYEFDGTFCGRLITCNNTNDNPDYCSVTKKAICTPNTEEIPNKIYIQVYQPTNFSSNDDIEVCGENVFLCETNKTYTCNETIELDHKCMYNLWEFWLFITFMCLGTIAFNVSNSVSDAICFDVIGDEYDYGKQRVWGTIGFGLTALLSGGFVTWFSDDAISYTPAFIVMIVFIICDLICCLKLELPIIHTPDNIFKDLKNLWNNIHTKIFIIFAIFAGIVDGFIVYFLFWYLEDLAIQTGTENIKLLEGLIVAAETLGGEVIFFSVAGQIIERFGHATCFSMCFLFYALRLVMISVVPNPWWILLIEFGMQGPTYALTYTTIVAYANAIAPPGASATMQGIAAGMDDGFGYAIGSMLGGILYKFIGKSETFQIFALFGVTCSISHIILHKIFLRHREAPQNIKSSGEYKTPDEAVRATYEDIA